MNKKRKGNNAHASPGRMNCQQRRNRPRRDTAIAHQSPGCRCRNESDDDLDQIGSARRPIEVHVSKNKERAAERKKRGHDRGRDAFIGCNDDDSRKRHPFAAGNITTGHQLPGNLKEKRTGETA
jgi:hypothetical protein